MAIIDVNMHSKIEYTTKEAEIANHILQNDVGICIPEDCKVEFIDMGETNLLNHDDYDCIPDQDKRIF